MKTLKIENLDLTGYYLENKLSNEELNNLCLEITNNTIYLYYENVKDLENKLALLLLYVMDK